MPSVRRIKALGLITVLTVLILFYFTSGARQTRSSDFYTRTQDALAQRDAESKLMSQQQSRTEDDIIQSGGGGSGKGSKVVEAAGNAVSAGAKVRAGSTSTDDQEDDGSTVSERLRKAEEDAKRAADAKGRRVKQEVMGEGVGGGPRSEEDGKDGKSVAGRVYMKDGESGSGVAPGVAGVGGKMSEKERKGEIDEEETEEEHQTETELNIILKKSPSKCFPARIWPNEMLCESSIDSFRSQLLFFPKPIVRILDGQSTSCSTSTA
jgi:hypothetical protein